MVRLESEIEECDGEQVHLRPRASGSASGRGHRLRIDHRIAEQLRMVAATHRQIHHIRSR